MKIRFSVASHKGKVRSKNEDNVFVNYLVPEEKSLNEGFIVKEKSAEKCMICIFDGMGGESFGDKASRIAAEKLKEFELICNDKMLGSYVERSNYEICKEMAECNSSMGTTMALVTITGDDIFVSNIGDSKIFRIRNEEIEQLSNDHTRKQSMLDAGIISAEELSKKKINNYLTQYLGLPEDDAIIQAHSKKDIVIDKDIFIISSDGLTDMLSDDKIVKIAMNYKKADEIAKGFIRNALQMGGKDNVTVAVIICET